MYALIWPHSNANIDQYICGYESGEFLYTLDIDKALHFKDSRGANAYLQSRVRGPADACWNSQIALAEIKEVTHPKHELVRIL